MQALRIRHESNCACVNLWGEFWCDYGSTYLRLNRIASEAVSNNTFVPVELLMHFV